MKDISHDALCQCVDCRRARTRRSSNTSQQQRGLELPPLELSPAERAAIEEDPLGFILVMKELDNSDPVILIKLKLAGVDDAEAADLMERAVGLYNDDRRERGDRRVRKGVGLTVLGLIITVPMALFGGGIFILIGVIAFLAGLVQLDIGIYEIQRPAARHRAGKRAVPPSLDAGQE